MTYATMHSAAFLWILRLDKFDPHRPYQPNRLTEFLLIELRLFVYLSCPLPIRPNTIRLTIQLPIARL